MTGPVFVLGAIPLFVGLLIAFVVGGGGLSIWATYALLRALSRRAIQAQHPDPSRLPHVAGRGHRVPAALAPGGPAWRSGVDLLRYPQRLAALEGRLQQSHADALDQAAHLRSRADRLSSKDEGSDLVLRYGADAGMLETRAASMRRVMGLVWRSRAILVLRAHVAITARARPDLDGLPGADVPEGQLQRAAGLYEGAAERVRAYVIHVESRLADLSVSVPAPPTEAELVADDREAVRTEQARARETYVGLQNRMDRLADTLSYLADRCLTRQVVHRTNQGVDGLAGSEGILEEVSEALAALGDLAELGDRQLADTAMDNLAEDISQLEQAGLDVQAEAEASLEIERLLEQFPGRK